MADALAAPGRRDLTILRRLFVFLWPYRRQVIVAGFALTVAAGTVLGFGWGLRWLIDEGFARGEVGRLDDALAGLFAIVIVMACATYMRAYYVSWLGERVAADIRNAVFANVVRMSPAFFETTRTGEVISRLTTDTTLLQTVIGSSASMALRNVLLVIGGAAMMAVTSPKLTLLVLVVVPLVVAPIIVFGRRVRSLSRASQDRIGDIGASVDETLNAVRTVHAFNREAIEAARIAKEVESAFTIAMDRVRARSLMAAAVILLVFIAIGVVLWIGGHDAIAGKISAGDLSAFVFYAVIVASSVGAISEFAADLQRAAGASERLFELLNAKSDIVVPVEPVPLPVPPRGAVAFENVTFHYPARADRASLTELSLSVAPGETVAIVGPSGAGKTTIFQLLLRFYDPQSGHILFDGVDIARTDLASLRSRLGFVPQEPVIFATNVMENIRYGRPDATDEEVLEAALAAKCHAFIEALPGGFDTIVGDRGLKLSGGQRQRIAIARAFLKDAPILLLDEATSALDIESEEAIREALVRLMRGRTVIAIAHRLSTLRSFDRIIVLREGRIDQDGPPDKLMRREGPYRELVRQEMSRLAKQAA